MKAILMSIHPQWVVKILNKEKTIEVRKRFPKDYVGWVYIYCTKLIPYGYGCMYDEMSKKYETTFCNDGKELPNLTGKVVARFWCDKVEEINKISLVVIGDYLKSACLSVEELQDYSRDYKYKTFAIHITKLEIFDKPKEISEFRVDCFEKSKCWRMCKVCSNNINLKLPWYDKNHDIIKCDRRLTRAPQSYCYIEV